MSSTFEIKVARSPDPGRAGQPYVEITEVSTITTERYWRVRRGEWRTPHGQRLSSNWAAVAEEIAGNL